MLKFVAIAACLLAGAPALSAGREAPAVRVAVADLDVATPAGLRVLDGRLAVAVRALCPAPLPGDLRAALEQRPCLRAATRTAAAARARLLAQARAEPVELAIAR